MLSFSPLPTLKHQPYNHGYNPYNCKHTATTSRIFIDTCFRISNTVPDTSTLGLTVFLTIPPYMLDPRYVVVTMRRSQWSTYVVFTCSYDLGLCMAAFISQVRLVIGYLGTEALSDFDTRHQRAASLYIKTPSGKLSGIHLVSV